MEFKIVDKVIGMTFFDCEERDIYVEELMGEITRITKQVTEGFIEGQIFIFGKDINVNGYWKIKDVFEERKVFLLVEYDIFCNYSSREVRGVFDTKEKLLKAIGHGSDTFKENYYKCGEDQFKSDTLEITLNIEEYPFNNLAL